MKKIITRIFITFVVISTLIIGCKKDYLTSTFSKNDLKEPTVENLIKSQSFTKLINLTDSLQDQMQKQILNFDRKWFSNSIKSGYISKSELEKFSFNLGFKSSIKLFDFLQYQDKLVKEIKQEFKNIESVSSDTLYEAINILKYKSNFSEMKRLVENPDDLCKRIYDNCMKRAQTEYVAAVMVCTITAISLTPLIGPGGLIVQISCGLTALHYLGLRRDECGLNFESCMQNQYHG